MIVGDLVEWLGQALNEAAKQQKPKPATLPVVSPSHRLLDDAVMRVLTSGLGLRHLEAHRSPLDMFIRYRGECLCGVRFAQEIDELAIRGTREPMRDVVLPALMRARFHRCIDKQGTSTEP